MNFIPARTQWYVKFNKTTTVKRERKEYLLRRASKGIRESSHKSSNEIFRARSRARKTVRTKKRRQRIIRSNKPTNKRINPNLWRPSLSLQRIDKDEPRVNRFSIEHARAQSLSNVREFEEYIITRKRVIWWGGCGYCSYRPALMEK